MEIPRVAPAEWIRGWIAMLDARQPGWRREYDPEAFELAVADLFGDAPQPAFGSTDLDILGEFSLGGPERAAEVCRRELGASGEFRRALTEFEFQFRLCHGSSRASAPLRQARAEALGKVIDVLLRPLVRRLDRMGHAMDMRDRRASRRSGALRESVASTGLDAIPPLLEAMGREAADRVALRARAELTSPALSAVRLLLLDPEAGPACRAAAREGISPASLTRAVQRIKELTLEELEGCPEEVHRPFTVALFRSLASE